MSPTWPIACTLTVCIALQLDSHNVLPLLRLSNYYEVSLHLHRYALQFAGSIEAAWWLDSVPDSADGPSMTTLICCCSYDAAHVPLLAGLCHASHCILRNLDVAWAPTDLAGFH